MTSTIKRTIKGGAYFFASDIITKGLGFLFILLSSRYLGPMEFGIFSLGLSVSGIAMNLGSFGLPTTIQRFLSGEGEGERASNIYGGILILSFVIAVLFSISLFVFSSYISNSIFDEPKLTIVLRVFAVGLIVNIGFRIYKALLQSQEQVKEILIASTVKSVLKISFLLGIFIWIQDAVAAAIAMELAGLFALIYLIKSVIKLPLTISLPTKNDLKQVLRYSLPLVFVGFSYFLAQQTDRIMLGWLSTSTDVGIYTVSSTLALIMTTLHGALVSIFMPLASKAYRKQNMEELNKAYLFISKWVGSVNGILSLVFAGAGIALLNIFGSEYSSEVTYQILLILTVLYFFGTWVGPTGALLQMADGHKLEMYNTAIYLVLNIGFNYVFILKYGLIGAAWGTLISGLVRNVLQVIEIKYLYGLKVISSVNLKLLVLILTGMLLCLIANNYSVLIAILFIAIVVLFIIYNITKEENIIIKNVIEKYVKK